MFKWQTTPKIREAGIVSKIDFSKNWLKEAKYKKHIWFSFHVTFMLPLCVVLSQKLLLKYSGIGIWKLSFTVFVFDWTLNKVFLVSSVWDGEPLCHEVRASNRETLRLWKRSKLQLLPPQVHLTEQLFCVFCIIPTLSIGLHSFQLISLLVPVQCHLSSCVSWLRRSMCFPQSWLSPAACKCLTSNKHVSVNICCFVCSQFAHVVSLRGQDLSLE